MTGAAGVAGAAPPATDVDARRGDLAETSANGARRTAVACRKLWSIASRLGETHAGHRLREGLIARTCAFASRSGDDAVWHWPWSALERADNRPDLPPRRVAAFGLWDVRCDNSGQRQRCAVTHAAADPANAGPAITTHFVIDTLAGRATVLWRVFVPAAVLGLMPGNPWPVGDAAKALRVVLPDGAVFEPFDQCGARGCLMEAELAVAASVMAELWDGRPVEFNFVATGTATRVLLPGLGLREAMRELMRRKAGEDAALQAAR